MTMIITDQKISDDDAVHVVRADRHRVRIAGVEDRLDGVDRAGADVAEHDTSAPTTNANRTVSRRRTGAKRRGRFGTCVHGEVLSPEWIGLFVA